MFLFCFFVFLKLKIYILIHIRLCRRVSDKKNSPGRFPETRLLFLPDGKDELNASPIWDRSQNLFFVLSPGYITFLCLKPRLYHKLVNTINRSVRFSESPVCFILPLFYKCWSERKLLTQYLKWCNSRGGSRAAATSKMERFVIIVNGFQPLTIIIKRSILDVAAALHPPLNSSVNALFQPPRKFSAFAACVLTL